MIKTISLSGSSAVKLSDEPYFYKSEKYVWIRNKSDADIFISNNSTDFLELPAGYAGRLDVPPGNTIYFDGSGDAEIYTAGVPVCPWKIVSDGDSGGGSAVLGTKTVTENGVYYASADGLDGFSRVTVNTPVKTLGEKYITKNGLYDASGDSLDGYDKVTVDVPCIIIGTASEVTL